MINKLREILRRLRPRKILGRLFWVLFGVALSTGVAWYKDRTKKNEEARARPESILSQAEAARRRLTEGELASAVVQYKSVLGDIEKNPSLDPLHRLQARAYSGLSRTYADWATLRFWRGISRGDYPALAEDYFKQACKIAPNDPETEIARLYAYESFGDSPEPKKDSTDDCTQSHKSITKDQMKEDINALLGKGVVTLDTMYLAYLLKANDRAGSFPNELHPQDVPEVRILVDVALGFAKLVKKAEPAEKEKYVNHAEHLLDWAVHLSPNNPFVQFVKGYLSAEKGNDTEAHDFYAEAIRLEIEFPRARNNLGVAYAAKKDYLHAQEQFEAAIRTVGAPAQSVRLWRYNLASASLESGDNTKACESWNLASEISGADDDPRTFVGLAECDWINKNQGPAVNNFRRAVELGKKQGLDLTNISWFEQQKAGPKELETLRALIQADASTLKSK